MSDPVRIGIGALHAIKNMEDETHREIALDAFEDELRKIRGGCLCERMAKRKANTRIQASVFHGELDVAQVAVIRDGDCLDGSGKTIGEAVRSMNKLGGNVAAVMVD